ncbi:MAG: SUMF1/EgtB/PvdO family nonheme iron enzyme [Anaerolineales bacterium]|nr:SUMF1/EgtB/PvdO family nonheme iron enzyme [Anaerolineales bacterium]
MKKVFYLVSMLTVLSLVLAACGAPAANTDSADPGQSGAAGLEEAPTEAPPADAAVGNAGLQTVDLAGPPMEVGSKFLYVDGTVLIAVPGGPFTMGYNFADNPEREITVGDFWMYSTKVTNRQYALCVQAGKCTPPDPTNAPSFSDTKFTNFPVTGVTHTQAAEYCGFVHGSLPTEAQWEKAARGPDGNIFPWGNGAPTCSLTNYGLCKGQTNSVNDYPDGKSFYEAWDMAGNVREWVADWYSPVYNVESPVQDPLGPELGEKRSVRGSSYADSANITIAAHRFSLDPAANAEDVGFRCVVTEPTYFAPWCELVGYAGIGPDGSPAECTPTVQCNDVNVNVEPFCDPQTQNTFTIVTFEMSNNPPMDWAYDAPGCNPISGEQTPTKDKFLCEPPGSGGTATTTGSCTDVAGCAATCPMHYTKDGDKCVWDGSGTEGTACLPGATYDPLTQCCTATPGTGVDFGLCPVGFYELGGVCVPNPTAFVDTASAPITIIPSCIDPTDEPGDDPGDPGGGEPGGGPCPPPQVLVCPRTAPCFCK